MAKKHFISEKKLFKLLEISSRYTALKEAGVEEWEKYNAANAEYLSKTINKYQKELIALYGKDLYNELLDDNDIGFEEIAFCKIFHWKDKK